MKPHERLCSGIAALIAVVALAGCGQPPPPAAADVAPPAPVEPVRTSPPPPEPTVPAAEPQAPAPTRVEPPAPRAKATPSPKSETVAEYQAPPPPAPPPPPAAPREVVKTLPVGTPVDLIFLDGLSSELSHTGDPFRARVAQDIRLDGIVVVPAGSIAHGQVGEVTPMKKIGGTARLVLDYSRLELPDGSSLSIAAATTQEGKSQTKKDAATIGGAAAGGAVLGKLIGKGSKEALIGAVVGAGVGTAVAAKNKGEQVEIPVGTQLAVELTQAVEITIRRP